MSMPKLFEGRLSVPVIASPLFIISQPELVIAECRAGVVGAFPSLNARPSGTFEDWLKRLRSEMRFPSPEALRTQIGLDVARAQRYFSLCKTGNSRLATQNS